MSEQGLVSVVELSLVVPMYNESESLEHFFSKVIPQLQAVTEAFEIICVNDGSGDNTWALLNEYAARDPRIKLINLSRNFGKELALTAGLDHSAGLAVIPIDADLQDPPELIPAMVEKWREGYHMVLAQRVDRSSDSPAKRWSSALFYSLLERLSDVPVPKQVGDFRLIDRAAVEYLHLYRERSRFMKGLFASLGFRQTTLTYTRPERAAGDTKWGYVRLFQLALEGIISFTSLPLKIWSYIGLSIAGFAFCYGIYLIGKTLLLGIDVPGYASLMVVMLFMSGITLTCLGVFGEYLSRIFIEVKRRPLYIVMERINLSAPLKRHPYD